MHFKYILLIAAGLLFSACATSTPYGPANGGYGFSEQRIEDNRYRITFRGNSSTPRQRVENYLLYRAAELTLQRGYDYYVIVESDTETKTSYSRTSYYPAFYGRYYYTTRRGRRYYHFPYYAYGFSWAYPYDSYVREITRYSAVAFVTMHEGEKPTDDPHAFDARSVQENLRPFVDEAR